MREEGQMDISILNAGQAAVAQQLDAVVDGKISSDAFPALAFTAASTILATYPDSALHYTVQFCIAVTELVKAELAHGETLQ
jgi:hypothetical protein